MGIRTTRRIILGGCFLSVIAVGFASEPVSTSRRLSSANQMSRTSSERLETEFAEISTRELRRDEQFARARAIAAASGSARVIVELDVPNYRGLAAASSAARGRAAIGAADGQVTNAIAPVRQGELAKLVGTNHTVNRTYSTIPFVAMTVDVNTLDRLKASRGIVGVTEDFRDPINLDTTPAIVGAPVAWAQGYDGSGTYVAVLDTGIRATHNFFAGKTIVQACFSLGQDGVGPAGDCPNGLSEDTTSPNAARHFPTAPTSDHGSHVTGIATGNDPGRVPPLYGIARGADIISVQVFYQDFTFGSLFATVADQLAGLEYVYSLRSTLNIAAVNMSLGGGSFSDQTACDSANASRKTAIDNLRAAGIATIIASGNDGFCGSISGPGCVSTAVAVGNVNDFDVENVGSNFQDQMIDLFGEGVEILSSTGFGDDSTYQSAGWTGTSMATPHVTGAFAILHQAAPSADVDTILAALQATGQPVSGHCIATPTAKRIQIDAALEMLLAGHPKFRQLPDSAGESVHSDVDLSDTDPNAVAADDFLSDGRPTHSVRWWGSNLSMGAASAAASSVNSKNARRPVSRPAPEFLSEEQVAALAAEKARFAETNPPTAATPGDGVLVGGDTCGTPTVIATLPYSDLGDSCTGSNNYDPGATGTSCPFTGGTADDVVYSYAPASNVDVEITLCGNSAYDTKLYVYVNACGGAVPDTMCNDDSCTTPSFTAGPWVSTLPSVSMSAGNTYYIIVDGYQTSCGAYTLDVKPIVCGDGILAGSEECDPPNGTTCNASCQTIVCGDGFVEGLEACDPPNGITCDATCQPIANPPIDGWLISFHQLLSSGGSPAEPLGLYFCDAAVVDVRATPLGACDLRPVREYFVRLEDCCVLAANVDSRTSNTPGQIDGFHDESCLYYDIDIQAVMGTKYFVTGGGPGVCDNSTATGNSATIPYWAWHTSPTERGGRSALSSTVIPPGANWSYAPWSNVSATCAAANMAFELLTDDTGAGDCNDNGIPDVCESGIDCQPNGIFDDCDIASGTSLDCQPNSIPDECDITGGAPDCQPDGVPDGCQLAGNDANGNNVPDECDPAMPSPGPGPNMVRAVALSLNPGLGAAFSVDDGVAEDSIGVNTGGGPPGQAFGWANRFTNTSGGPITLIAVEVAFGSPLGGGGLAVGDRVDAAIWLDASASANMANAVLLTTWALPGGIHAGNGTYATHYIPGGGAVIPAGADYYVGMGDVQTSIDSLVRFPAAIDTTPPTQNRSWAFIHPTLNIFDPNNLASQSPGTIEALSGGSISGNWLVRARLAAPASPTALRVDLVDLQTPIPSNPPSSPPPNFGAFEVGTCTAGGEGNGCVRWVGPVVTAFQSQDNPGLGSYQAARLQCTPYYYDWSANGLIHVLGAEVIPSSSYQVYSVAASCAGTEPTCLNISPPLSLTTTRWGDLTTPFNPPSPTVQPDSLDIVGVLNRYKSQSGSPLHASAAIQPNTVDPNVDVSPLDVVATVDAYKGVAYPYTGPCACPSTVTCNATPCTTPTPCAGGMCIRTCTGGPNDGQPCTSNVHCSSGVCNTGGFCRDRCGRCSP